MEKGKAPAKGYYRGSSSNANPVATANEHDVVANRADAHCNANPVATVNEHDIVANRADAVCIDLTNDAEGATEVEIHRHFSIRGYVAEIRRNNPRFYSLFPGTNNFLLQLPPLEVPSFRWWRCDDCVSSITGAVDTSANASLGHGAGANNVNQHNDNVETQCPSVEASEGHGADANNVNECNDNTETRCPSVEASEGHGVQANNVNQRNDNIETRCPLVEGIIILDDDEDENVSHENINASKTSDALQDSEPCPENRGSDETRAASSDGKNAVPSNAALEERGTGIKADVERLTLGSCQNQQTRRKGRKIRTMIDLLSSCERQLRNDVSTQDQIADDAFPSVPRVPALDSPGNEAALAPLVRRKTANAQELGARGRKRVVTATKRKTPDSNVEPEWTRMRHRITRTVMEMSGDGSLKRAAEMSSSPGSRTISLPLHRDDSGRPLPAPKRARGNSTSAEQCIVPAESAEQCTSDLGQNPVTQNPVEADLQRPVPRSSRAEIRDFDLNVPASPEDGTEEEERPSSNAEPLPRVSMAAGNPIPAQGTLLPNPGFTPGAAPVLIQRPSEPSLGLNPGRISAFRQYQRPKSVSPLVAGSSNQHSTAEYSSSCAGARAGSSREETEVCQVNRNPADFSVVEPGNPFMIGCEDPKKRKKISRAAKGKGKMDEAD